MKNECFLLLTALLLFVGFAGRSAMADVTVFLYNDSQYTYCTPYNASYTELNAAWNNAGGATFSDSKTAAPASGSPFECNGNDEMWASYVNYSCRCFVYWDDVDQIAINTAQPPNHNTSPDFKYSHAVGCA